MIGLENHRLSADGGCEYENNAENEELILTHSESLTFCFRSVRRHKTIKELHRYLRMHPFYLAAREGFEPDREPFLINNLLILQKILSRSIPETPPLSMGTPLLRAGLLR